MVRMNVEIKGSAEEVVRVIQQLGSAGQWATEGDAGGCVETPGDSGGQTTPAGGVPTPGSADEAPAGEWTETLAGEFLAGLEPATRRVVRHIWQGNASGIRRSALCQRTELTPRELHSLLMRMGHALRRFQRERGVTLPRPVASNRPQQSYSVDADFVAVVNSQMFEEEMGQPLADGAGRP